MYVVFTVEKRFENTFWRNTIFASTMKREVEVEVEVAGVKAGKIALKNYKNIVNKNIANIL